VCFHEKQNVNQHGWYHTSNGHPDFQGLVFAAGVDDPAPFSRAGRRQTLGHPQFVSVGVRNQVVEQHHRDDCDRHSEITQCSTRLMRTFVLKFLMPETKKTYTASEKLAVSELPQVVGDEKCAYGQNEAEQRSIWLIFLDRWVDWLHCGTDTAVKSV
jgi:hypothetical protein